MRTSFLKTKRFVLFDFTSHLCSS